MKKKVDLKDLKLKRLRFKRLRYRNLIVVLGILAVVVLAFNYWFINHAEDALEQIVYSQSKGKLKLKIANFKFNWIKNKIELQQASIYSTDTTAPTSYAVNSKNIFIKARGFLPLLFNREILIDSIVLSVPGVVFTRLRAQEKLKDTVAVNDTSSFSVAEEMGRISRSITAAINVLKIDKFRLNDGSFSLIDKTRPNERPFIVNNVYVELDNLQVDSTTSSRRKRRKMGFTDNVAVRTFDQNIAFPGGRHFIAFKDFRVNLRNKRVEFDSCTLRAVKGDSSNTSFKIFFSKLQLTNINFDSLYSSETIIADSVYCSRPKISLDIDGDINEVERKKKKKARQGTDRIDAVVQQLLGDMRLQYVGVKNADIDVKTIQNKKSSAISSKDIGFEIYKLNVRQGAERPVSMEKFVMSLHHSENVLNNGRYAIAFDSVGFEDDVINLSKFSFKEFQKGKAIKSLSMPVFQVRGLSWESLLYDNIFSAQSAKFYNPTVQYTLIPNKRKAHSKTLFETLNGVDDVMDLKNLGIYNGDLQLNFSKGGSLHLFNTNLDLRANDFTSASQIKNVQRSVNNLSFDKGVFKKGALTAHLNQVDLSDNKSGLHANSMELKGNGIAANARDIIIGAVVLDSISQSIMVDGVTWQNAVLDLSSGKNKTETKHHQHKKTPIVLRNIKGRNTLLNVNAGANKITGTFNAILLNEFTKNELGKPEIKGMSLDGQNVLLVGDGLRLSADKLDIQDNNHSVVEGINVQKQNAIDTILAVIPRLTIIPNITEIVSGNLTLQGLVLHEPKLTAKLGRKDNSIQKEKKATSIKLGNILFEKPDINISMRNKENRSSYLHWDAAPSDGYLRINNLESTPEVPIKADQIKMYLANVEWISAKAKKYTTHDNKLNIELNDVLVAKNENDKIDWSTSLNILDLNHLVFDSIGKKNSRLELDQGDIKNVMLNSKNIGSLGSMITGSKYLNISGTNGKWATANRALQWYGFTAKENMFGVDSLSFLPYESLEEYRSSREPAKDFMQLTTGKIISGPIDVDKYAKDSILDIGHVEINDANLFIFNDRLRPATAKRYKPLPVELLQGLHTLMNVDSLALNNMLVTYGEYNPETDSLGIIPVSDLNVLIKNIKNYNIHSDDSIHVVATANVLEQLHTALNLSQSYTDSLGTMRMNVTTGPVDFSHFNSVLVPLVGAKIFDGKLTGMSFNALADNNAAIGSGYMYYNNLKLGLLDKKDLSHQTFMNKLVSKLAMAFVVRKNNNGKQTLLFYERGQDKSATNYVIKTTLAGIKSGVGLPGAKKKLRKYNKKAIH